MDERKGRMMINFEVSEELIKKYNLTLLVLFGSFGTKYAREDSDLDLGFISEDVLEKDREIELLNDIIRLYRRSNIDLVNLKKASPGLKLEAAKNGRVIYEQDNAFLKFQIYAAGIFADTIYLRKDRKETLESKIKELH